MKGQIVGGEFSKLIVRQKSDAHLELGELLVAEKDEQKHIFQVFDLLFGSQISQQNLELIAGMQLEDNTATEFMDPQLRNYSLALLKGLVNINSSKPTLSKTLPSFFSTVREITKEDMSFLTAPKNPFFLGKLRSGSKVLDVDLHLQGDKVLSHHILVAGTTGRGKSNLLSNLLWHTASEDYCGILVLDPHDEYYGRDALGLKDHPNAKVSYYSAKEVPPGQKTLVINLELVKPHHLSGVLDFTDTQQQGLRLYHKKYKKQWIEAVILEKPLTDNEKQLLHEGTIAAMRRKLMSVLDVDLVENKLYCTGVFQLNAGMTTISDITKELEEAKTVVINTSSFSGAVELLIGSMVAHEVFSNYKKQKITGTLKDKPVISIVLEEAPRVLGKEVLEKGQNIFSTIAREGRKFKVGITAITQLPSLIPRQILANMNTKIILGVEMKPERQALIESAAQDLSDHDRSIASLDVGEVLVTSNFSKFVLPVKVPLFEQEVKGQQETPTESLSISELKS